jgi:hypothetical protein
MSGDSFILTGRRARAVIATVSAGALALLAGCSAGTTPSPAAKQASPRTALLLAAKQSEQLTSMTASTSAQANGTQTLAGTVTIQYKPALLLEATVNVMASGQSLGITEIVSSTAMYLKMAELSKLAGKPWVKIPFSELSGSTGAQLSQLLQNVEDNNPQQQARMLTASKNVRELGKQTVDGISTTEYAGSYTVASAMAVLSPSQRRVLGPQLKQLTGAIHFTDWIDAQHHVRKTVVTETVSGQQVTLTTNVTAINQPVNIKLPPRRRVAQVPAGSL